MYYCDEKCQTAHWPEHKKKCKTLAREFSKSKDDASLSADAHATRAQRYMMKRKWAKAEAEYRKAIAKAPKCARHHGNLGIALKYKGDLDGAIASYERGLSLDPNHAMAH